MKIFHLIGFKLAGLQRRKVNRYPFFRLISRLLISIIQPGRALLLIFISVFFIFLSQQTQESHKRFKTFFSDFSAFLVDVINKPFDAFSQLEIHFSTQETLRKQISSLKLENQYLRNWRQVALQIQEENKNLKKLSKLVGKVDKQLVTARVVGKIYNGYNSYLQLAASKSDGIKKNYVVLSATGLLGRIIETGKYTSRVLLLSDVNSRVPVEILPSGEQAIVVGQNDGNIILKHVERLEKIKNGDKIITSGYGGIFPRGLEVGTLFIKDKSTLNVIPSANVKNLRYVLIVGQTQF